MCQWQSVAYFELCYAYEFVYGKQSMAYFELHCVYEFVYVFSVFISAVLLGPKYEISTASQNFKPVHVAKVCAAVLLL